MNLVTQYAHANLAGMDQWFVRISVGLVQMALGYVLTAALVRGTIVDLDGRKASLGDCLAAGMRYAAPASPWPWSAGFAHVVGLSLFIVPGVILMLAWSVATPVLVVERKKACSAHSPAAPS